MNAIIYSLGAFSGSLIYTRFISSSADFDWSRALFLGVTTLFAMLISRKVNYKRKA